MNQYELFLIIFMLGLLLITACNPIINQPSSSTIPSPSPTITPTSSSISSTSLQTFYNPPLGFIEFTVVDIIDGDTIEVSNDSENYTVRYIGIDAPELDEAFGIEAMEKNRELVEGKIIKLEKDVTETDQYGRLLGYIYAEGVFVNAELVRLGYAHAVSYPPDTKHDGLFNNLETKAKDINIGIWETIQPTKTIPNTTKITPPPRN
ncbi:MAG: thermonuclease family protein [Dehalococcoidia bacterium]|nr:MAG: thermonuclease family protein [Dehalococcoidia bacterium]